MKLKRDLTRGKLCEGRNNGLSFALCNRKGKEFTELMPMSPCKDYLNDAIYTERTGKSGKVYGFQHIKTGVFEKARRSYFSVANLTASKAEGPTKEVNLNNALAFINKVEDNLGITRTKVIETDIVPVLSINNYWTQQPYLISAYGLLFREALSYKAGDDLRAYVAKLQYKQLTPAVYDKFTKLYSMAPPTQDLNVLIGQIHNTGIVNIKFENNEKIIDKVAAK